MLPGWTTKKSVRRPRDAEVFNGGGGDSSTGKKCRKTNGLAHTHSGSKSTGRRTWLLGNVQIHWKCRRSVGICPRKHGLVAPCSKPWKLETVFEMWKEPCIDGPGCLGDPCASCMTVTNAGATCWLWLARFVWQWVWTSRWLRWNS